MAADNMSEWGQQAREAREGANERIRRWELRQGTMDTLPQKTDQQMREAQECIRESQELLQQTRKRTQQAKRAL